MVTIYAYANDYERSQIIENVPANQSIVSQNLVKIRINTPTKIVFSTHESGNIPIPAPKDTTVIISKKFDTLFFTTTIN